LKSEYQLLDSGNGRKLERFGEYVLSRPCAQAVWYPKLDPESWEKAHAFFTREGKEGWTYRKKLPSSWTAHINGISFHIHPTDFGHLGVFPEQRHFWDKIRTLCQTRRGCKVLNLFAYSGGSTLAAAQGGAGVCHLDASKGMVQQARENAQLNGLEKAPIRWIVEDVMKFLQREIRRGNRYDGIILDPPSFGRGSKGEVFKIEQEILPLLKACKTCLSETPLLLLFSCHTPTFSPLSMQYLLEDFMPQGEIESGEMVLDNDDDKTSRPIPSGTYSLWSKDK
jgi:23S rRNA (cytosine1962-C5)-methyltransferase